ncbi:MAG TPA: HNH endonuclease signature motif containing protein [Acidimicrobiales bacterium]|nr:HNH endonuclease signature motif containing protein [Acidimicrobiales bacterium]
MLVEELSRATSLLRGVVASLGADLSGAEAARLTEGFSAVSKLAGAGMAICARAVAETGHHEGLGHLEAGSWLGELSGQPCAEARRLISTAGRLAGLPRLEEAFRAGELSAFEAAEVARGAAADPLRADELLAAARGGSLRQLRAEADRAEAAARSREEDEARHARIHAARHLRTWLDADGSLKGRFSLTPTEGALLLSGLEAEANHLFDLARRAGLREPRQAYLADALVAIVSGQAPTLAPGPPPSGGARSRGPAATRPARRGRPDATILFHVDLEALARGSLGPGEECVVEGGGHVPLSVVESYLETARIRLVVRDGCDVVAVVSAKRTIPAVLQTALCARDRTCVVPGCSSTFHLEIDHIVEFAKGGQTKLSNLCRLCRMHHAQKTQQGYRIEGGPGAWRWLPPPKAPPPAPRPRQG